MLEEMEREKIRERGRVRLEEKEREKIKQVSLRVQQVIVEVSDSLTYILLILTYLGRPCTGGGGEEEDKEEEEDKKDKKKREGEIEKEREGKNIFSLAYTLHLLTIYIQGA